MTDRIKEQEFYDWLNSEKEQDKIRLYKIEVRVNYYLRKHNIQTKLIFTDLNTWILFCAELSFKFFEMRVNKQKPYFTVNFRRFIALYTYYRQIK